MLADGYYDLSIWGPATLLLLAAAVALVLAGRPPVPHLALVVLAGLIGLWAWTLLSTRWADAASDALLAADRWLLYAALFALVVTGVLLVAGGARVLLVATAASVVALEVYFVVRLLGPHPQDLFVLRRLSTPLGYTNGVAGYLLLGLWPLVAAAERVRPVGLAAPALGLATLEACLVLLTQSRGAAIAMAISIVVLLAVVPGRRRRAWALLVIAAAVALATPSLLDVYHSSHSSRPSPAAVHHAVLVALLASTLAAIVWAIALKLTGSLTRRWSDAGLAVVGVVLVALLLGFSGRIAHEADVQYHAFVSLKSGSGTSRLLTGSGHRYDYWRIAWKEFTDHPLVGVGGGNYPADYFRRRRTGENIRQPHSIELQSLAEVGLVGFGFLAAFAAAIAAGLARAARAARSSPGARTVAVAAGGIFVVWLAQTSVDWLHLLPGLTAVALCAAATLVARFDAERRWGAPSWALTAACLAVAALGALTVARPTIAQHARTEGRSALSAHPRTALRHAERALSFDRDAPASYYLKAAALARLGDYANARATLLAAARRTPRNFVTWALLGDLARRRGDTPLAGRYYARARALNPRVRPGSAGRSGA